MCQVTPKNLIHLPLIEITYYMQWFSLWFCILSSTFLYQYMQMNQILLVSEKYYIIWLYQNSLNQSSVDDPLGCHSLIGSTKTINILYMYLCTHVTSTVLNSQKYNYFLKVCTFKYLPFILLIVFFSPSYQTQSLCNILDPWCEEPTHWKRPWYWESLRAREEGGDRGWDGWMASLTQWKWKRRVKKLA